MENTPQKDSVYSLNIQFFRLDMDIEEQKDSRLGGRPKNPPQG